MYNDFFSLREEPFSLTPDPSFLYLSKRHMELLSNLHYGVHWRKGFVEVSGEVGAGKTTVCRMFLEGLKGKAETALILNPNLSESQLLQAIVEDFGIKPRHNNKKALFDALNSFLLETQMKGKLAVLIIDEAQRLSIKALEQIRLISNLETAKAKLIQIILVGQPELRNILSSPDLIQLRQRIAVRYYLNALNFTEVEEYIMHRLNKAGASEGTITFSPQAIKSIYDYTKGIPRMINVLCDKALLAAFIKSTKVINFQIVAEAIKDLEGEISIDSEISKGTIYTV